MDIDKMDIDKKLKGVDYIATQLEGAIKEAIHPAIPSFAETLQRYREKFSELAYVTGVYAALVVDPRTHPKNPVVLSVQISHTLEDSLSGLPERQALGNLVAEFKGEMLYSGYFFDIREVYFGEAPEGYVAIYEKPALVEE